jgi:hypothetical protein
MSYQCSNCGAAVDVPPDVMATTCNFCDSPLVDVDSRSEPVDRLIPFSVDRARAGTLLRKYLQSAWLAPEPLRKSARPTDLRAVMVPFYCYEALARTNWSSQVGVEWQRQETYTTTDSDGKTVTRTRTVTETEWFPLDGSHAKVWHDHLVSASRGLPENEANELEPYDLGRSVPFDPAHLAGLVAEHPTIPHAEAESTAESELHKAEQAQIAGTFLPGDKHRSLHCNTSVQVRETKLVLRPVWIAVAGNGDEAIRMLVNGQTGEVVADLPKAWWKVALLVVLCLGFFAAMVGFFSTVAQ